MDNHSLEQKFNDFIEDLNIPQLNDEEISFLDKDLTPQGRTVLQKKCTKLFYLLCKDLLNSYNEAFCKG